ncbi:MAG: hypothetical protein PF448_01195 [Bacteroidales bacterium]|jgi:hypothetical protein|nr:hypothetical protein [Bacteroidales bacterium]
MKVLFLYCEDFSYEATIKTLDFVPEASGKKSFQNVQTAFIHVEDGDEENEASLFKKVVKQLKWILKKNETNQLIIHSFAHLAETKGDPKFTYEFLNKLEKRMADSGFETHQTPFGHFLNLHMDAPGFSLARVFKSF